MPKTSALAKYKGPYAQTGTYSRVSNSPRTATLRGRLYRDLGLNVESIGKLTDEQVRNSSLKVKELAKQIQRAQVYAQNAEQQQAALKELEGIRVGLLKSGDKTLRGLDRDLKSAVLTDARHQNHMQLTAQSTQNALNEVTAQGKSSIDLENAGFTARMKNLAATHRSKLSYQGKQYQIDRKNSLSELADSFNGKQSQIAAGHQERLGQQNWMNYLTGAGRSSGKKSLIGGLFS